ncbi:MAG: hypothetical protein AAFN41_01890 [Planctomycetota bacterium]
MKTDPMNNLTTDTTPVPQYAASSRPSQWTSEPVPGRGDHPSMLSQAELDRVSVSVRVGGFGRTRFTAFDKVRLALAAAGLSGLTMPELIRTTGLTRDAIKKVLDRHNRRGRVLQLAAMRFGVGPTAAYIWALPEFVEGREVRR